MKDKTIRRRSMQVAIAVSLALGSTTAFADVLEEIFVSARKVDERLQDVPVSITAFTSEALEATQSLDVYDLTRMTPGFSFERLNRYGVQGGVGRPVIRGMSNILGEGNASVFVDGILFSDSILAFPFDIVERVEIIKGPQAALLGRGTFSGAINLVTKKGTNTPEHKVSMRAAEYDDYEANILLRGPIQQDRVFYMLHGRYYTFGGMYDNTLDGRKVGGEESTDFNGSLEFRGDMFSALIGAGYSEIDDDMAAVTLQDRFANNCHLDVARQYYCGAVMEQSSVTLDRGNLQGDDGVHRDSTRLSAQLTWDFGAMQLVSNTGYFDTHIEYGYDSTYQAGHAIAPTTVPGAPGYVRTATDPVRVGSVTRNEVSDRQEWSTELRLQSAEEQKVRWLIGAYLYQSRRDLEERHYLASAPTILFGETRVDNQALFGSVGFDLSDRWDLSIEGRYAEDKVGNLKTTPAVVLIEKTFSSFVPRITTSFHATPGTMLYLSFAQGNKPGVVNADPRFPPDIQFADEEESDNWEIGVKNTLLDGRLILNAAAYYIDWKKQQLTTTFFFPTGGTQSYIINAGETEVQGLELEVQGRVTDAVTLGFSYAYTDAEFVELVDTEAGQLFGDTSLKGFTPPGVPQDQASVFARFGFNVGASLEGYVRADASYTSKKYDQVFNLAHTGSQELVNLTFGLDGKNWSGSLWVKNLTDDRTPSSVTRYVDQMNLNVPQYVNANPAQNNVPGSTTLERAFFYPLARKRQFGMNLTYRF
ncbi:MAG TPA: TonB-dependent receptor [Steroidobacteraceae bacterium]|jgi:outer membrane receptor protein involved in Fe transport